MTRPAARVAAVLLAGGESRRMGGIDKRTLALDGEPLVRRWLGIFRDAGIADVVVVLGHAPRRILPLLEGSGATVVINEDWAAGQQTSVLAGLRALPAGVDAAMVVLVDLVLVDAADLRELVDAFAKRPPGRSIVVPFHAGQRGNPVIVGAEVASKVAAGPPEAGGLREYLRTHPDEVHRHAARSDHFVVDLDTPADLERAERRLGRALVPAGTDAEDPPVTELRASPLTVESFFDEASSTFTHLVLDRESMQCALVDSVLDFDPRSGRTRTDGARRVAERVRELGARVQWLLETHVHADHLSAAPWLQRELGGRIAIGEHITEVQRTFGVLFNAGPDFARDGSQFDHLFRDGESFAIGGLRARAMHTPGHTPACMTYVVEHPGGAVAFVGDTLFMPDYGTARCDFPGGDAAVLHRSIRRVLALPPQTQLYMCHDYRPGGRPLRHVCTVAEQREGNVHAHDGVSEADFVAMRTARDATLEMPVLMLPAVQVNMRAGRLPPPESNGVRYLKIPLDAL